MQQRKDPGGVVRVEVAGGLVGQQKGGAVDQGAGYRGTLHLAAAHLVGEGVRPGGQTGQIEHFHGPGARLARFVPAEEEGKFDIFHRSHGGEQIEKLEYDAQPLAPVSGERGVVRAIQTQPIDGDLAGRRLIEAAKEIEQSALAAAARAGHRGKGPRRDLEADVAQSVHFARIGLIYSRDMVELDHGLDEGFRAARRAQDKFRVVAEGADWIAVDKPAGLLTHPTRPDGAPTLWDGLRALLAYELANRGQLSIITRLDRETSGLVLLALTPSRARALSTEMQRGGIEKEYAAIVQGHPEWEEKVVDAPIIRQGEVRDSKIWLKRCVDQRGAEARTELHVQKRFVSGGRPMTLVRAVPLTGRTHQIRVHLAHAGFPVVGDKIYGAREEAYLEFIETGWTAKLTAELVLPRHALHACALAFRDGAERQAVSVGLPADMEDLLAGLDPCGRG